ncbi:PAQR family membrane homeostasis protein TrhA [Vibrio sagamiensis]|uniref:Hemolysin III family protein n=1 Tax=Vibrio sagamiensis NBRC 104589 TaxID=1219064 RepID=A0A511QGE0_9VIBR|nr:hemolysin III family protein [Vibrio sagamiensis]PNQ71159.1 hemolysin III family protein [Vibrio agarivorans]GEM76267.1 hemolysin III family protein [Vibrio sagamiensis NBRC 104589]
MSKKQQEQYSWGEELANTLTHGFGIIFGIVGLVLLLNKAIAHQADTLTITSMAIYGSSMIVLFLASTLYHGIAFPKAKRWLKTFDHCAIYLLIAGSYTPFLLVSLRTPLAIGLMTTIWIIALIGIIMKVAFVYRFEKLSLATYLIMGWLSLVVIYQLVLHMDSQGVILLALGGLVYSIGVIFYVAERIPFNHAIWHGFVLAGCMCHFFAIYYFVEPVQSVV